MIIKTALSILLSLALLACSDSSVDDHGHSHEPESGEAHAPHDEGEAVLVFTDYSDRTELFVEFPALVAGQSSTFAAHVTRLSDYTPLNSGTMDVLLEDGGKVVARFRVTDPARTGIFMPSVKPRDAGSFELVIEITDGDLQARHELGLVRVYESPAAVAVDQAEREGDIGYLKEQQWANPFATALARTRPMRPSVPGFATVLAPADAGAEIRAPSDGYFAATRIVGAGDTVASGDVLAYLVPRLGQGSDFGSLVVDLERAQSRASLAAQDVERLQGLLEQGAIPERRLIEARQSLQVARAELAAARSRVDQHQSGGAEAGIALRAPLAGEVIEVNARPGAFVRAGDRIFRLAAPERRWLEVRVPERYASKLRQASGAWFDDAGQTIVLDSGNGARVVQTTTAIDAATRTASVTIEYPSAAGPRVIGQRLAAHVYSAEPEPRLAIPRSAVVDDGGRAVAYVQTGGEMFVRRPVELGLHDGDFVEIIRGVAAGERVVSRGAYYVKLASAGGEEVGHGHAH
ncbi:MAG: efflux RND transporter periplasmic adaptor subunit [Wenzhouxiangellaceae bacterium]|nr:efflux RND transporter periplasmic adaptor subunit [Wenzhouxiangellaceae bacterium]